MRQARAPTFGSSKLRKDSWSLSCTAVSSFDRCEPGPSLLLLVTVATLFLHFAQRTASSRVIERSIRGHVWGSNTQVQGSKVSEAMATIILHSG